MPSVLITGANRGIGLGFVREMLKEPSIDVVIATARNVEAAKVIFFFFPVSFSYLQLVVSKDSRCK